MTNQPMDIDFLSIFLDNFRGPREMVFRLKIMRSKSARNHGALWANLQIVQSLNSSFFLPFIGAEPGRAKGESRITCMRRLRTLPFFPPKSGEKPYLEVLSRFGLWRDFLNRELRQRSDYLFSSCNP